MARILFVPDSFKGSASSYEVSAALSRGWLQIRGTDEIHIISFADGGEGTLASIEAAQKNCEKIPVFAQNGHGQEHMAYWILINGDLAVIEMALICGITTMNILDPLGAHSFGVGEVIAAACRDSRVREIYVAVGGSASSDGGSGALTALGFKFLDKNEKEILFGGGSLHHIARIDRDASLSLPERGVKVLVDVQSPLVGDFGAAKIYAPQKGATQEQVALLEKGLTHLLSISAERDFSGYGAAGGVAFGLSALWGAEIVSGVETISSLVGLAQEIDKADCVVTGEGCFDSQSFSGKTVGHILMQAGISKKPIFIACGENKNEVSNTVVSLAELAQSKDLAMSHPQYWLGEAGKALARVFRG